MGLCSLQGFPIGLDCDMVKGFPGIITPEDNRHTMNLFAPLQHYTLDKLTQATADLTGISMTDLTVFSADMVGLG